MTHGCCIVEGAARPGAGGESEDRNPDLLVVGGGSGGFAAAIAAAETGARVVMVSDGAMGGTCVNVGCVPSKTMIRAMEAVHAGNRAARFDGVRGSGAVVDWKALVAQKQALVESLRKAKYADLLPEYPGVTYVRGRARFTGKGAEADVDGALYRPRKAIVATGASSALPPIPGIESVPVLDSTRALELERLPESLLVVGGGFIGVELGQMFARAGAKVTICCRSRLLPGDEPEVGAALTGYLREEGVDVRDGLVYRRVEKTARGVALVCETPDGELVLEAEQLLAATGRRPNTADLGLERAGVAVDGRGGVRVNEYLQTSHPDIYAVGDVTGEDMFVYMAAYGGKLAARNALSGNAAPYDNTVMPAVVFTDPQAAAVGLTEAAARARGYEVVTSVVALDNVARYIAARDTRGFVKLVADAKTDRLLGAAILAPEAGEGIQTAALALRAGMTTKELAETIFPYLTGVEALKLAAQGFRKDVKKLSCCAG